MRKLMRLMWATFILSSCSSIDCPLNNFIRTKYVLSGNVTTLTDTLTVSALKVDGKDTILLNRKIAAEYFLIPISYTQASDRLIFKLTSPQSVTVTDTVVVNKINMPHFESVDCPATFFHTITDLKWTRNAIDSMVITKSLVDNDTIGGHIQVYFKPGH